MKIPIMQASTVLLIASLSGALAVMMGAFGAHALKSRVEPALLAVFQTGVQYHFYHTLALLALGVLMQRLQGTEALLQWSAILFALGIVIFSGSLYLMTFTGMRWLGAITPIGGLCFIAAWLVLAFFSLRLVGDN